MTLPVEQILQEAQMGIQCQLKEAILPMLYGQPNLLECGLVKGTK
jgi:hypothetical protein